MNQSQENCYDQADFLGTKEIGLIVKEVKGDFDLKAVSAACLFLLEWSRISSGASQSSCLAYVRKEDRDAVRSHVQWFYCHKQEE